MNGISFRHIPVCIFSLSLSFPTSAALSQPLRGRLNLGCSVLRHRDGPLSTAWNQKTPIETTHVCFVCVQKGRLSVLGGNLGWRRVRESDRQSMTILGRCSNSVCVCVRHGVLTGAGHGCRVCFRAEVSLVAGAGGGALPDGVTVERTLGAGAVGGQSAVGSNLTG